MEPQGGRRRRISPFRVTKRSTKLRRLSKTTRSRVHVQTVGLNAETKKCRHRADGGECLLTFPFIGHVRFRDKSGLEPDTATSVEFSPGTYMMPSLPWTSTRAVLWVTFAAYGFNVLAPQTAHSQNTNSRQNECATSEILKPTTKTLPGTYTE